MKIDYRDIVFTTLALLLTLGLTLGLLHGMAPGVAWLFGNLYPLGYLLAFLLLYGSITALYLRLLTRFYPFHEGVYDMDHPQFTLWKHCSLMGELSKASLGILSLSLSRILYYRLLGTKVGANVAIGKVNITDPLLTELADFSIIGDGSNLIAHALTFDRLILRRIHIGQGATVGVHTVIMPGVEIGEHSIIAALSRVNPGTHVPAREFWEGVPAGKVKDLPPRPRR